MPAHPVADDPHHPDDEQPEQHARNAIKGRIHPGDPNDRGHDDPGRWRMHPLIATVVVTQIGCAENRRRSQVRPVVRMPPRVPYVLVADCDATRCQNGIVLVVRIEPFAVFQAACFGSIQPTPVDEANDQEKPYPGAAQREQSSETSNGAKAHDGHAVYCPANSSGHQHAPIRAMCRVARAFVGSRLVHRSLPQHGSCLPMCEVSAALAPRQCVTLCHLASPLRGATDVSMECVERSSRYRDSARTGPRAGPERPNRPRSTALCFAGAAGISGTARAGRHGCRGRSVGSVFSRGALARSGVASGPLSTSDVRRGTLPRRVSGGRRRQAEK